jgi:hypothetical protein
MLLSELFDAPDLRLHLLHAARGSYDRPIGRLITTDLLEPGNYLNGGELVLTGLVWRRTAADSETFVASVAGRGATTILAGAALLGAIPDDLLEACRRHQVTLVEVPIEVAFADVTEYVAAAGSADPARSREGKGRKAVGETPPVQGKEREGKRGCELAPPVQGKGRKAVGVG